MSSKFLFRKLVTKDVQNTIPKINIIYCILKNFRVIELGDSSKGSCACFASESPRSTRRVLGTMKEKSL